jgi:hypothetical protein
LIEGVIVAAADYNTVIDQGADWYINFQYEDSNGVPINLTNYTAKMQLRSLPTSATAVLTLTQGNGITIVGATGLLEIHATAAQTGDIDAGFYYYDLEITAPVSGVITRLIQGQIEVNPQVTR